MPSPVLVNDSLPMPHGPGDIVRWGKVYGCAKALAIAELAARSERTVSWFSPAVPRKPNRWHTK